MPRVSVIIPCYNQGEYVDEAVDSVLAQTFDDYEIIIVNDGSTDVETVRKLKSYNRPKTRVIHSENRGLPGARNLGIENAAGEYILPLDADDKISSTYLEEAVDVLDSKKDVGIVTCNVEFFGQVEGPFDLPAFSVRELLCHNIIICSSFFRRSGWEQAGGYDSAMKYGWEDHEFWISLVEKGAGVERLPRTHFFYRKYNDSMADRMTEEQKLYSMDVIYKKHKDFYLENMDKLFGKILELKDTAHNYLWQLHHREKEVGQLKDKAAALEGEIVRIHGEVEVRQRLIESMDAGIRGRDVKILELNKSLTEIKHRCESMERSLSWRITLPLRWLGGPAHIRSKESDEHGES